MMPGNHTLELAAFVNDGAVLESPRSSPVRVNVVAQTALANAGAAPSDGNTQTATGTHVPALREGVAARASAIGGLISPTDMAVAPDGRLFIAERSGAVRIVRDGRLLSDPAVSLADAMGADGQLLAIALDPQFDRSRFVFTIYTAPDRSGAPAFTLARFREVARHAWRSRRAARCRARRVVISFGRAPLRPGRKLYAAFDDGGDARRAQDPASLNGKVLRLNADGTTPNDATGSTPIYAARFGSPVAIDWDPPTSTMWVADRSAGAVPFTFYRGSLFPAWSGRLITASTLFDEASASGVSRVVVGPDGAMYYLTARGVGRLAP